MRGGLEKHVRDGLREDWALLLGGKFERGGVKTGTKILFDPIGLIRRGLKILQKMR